MRRPRIHPARAGISTPWQTLAIGLFRAKNHRVMRSRLSSSRMYSGARPPLKKNACVVLGLDLGDSHGGLNGVALPFLCDRPARLIRENGPTGITVKEVGDKSNASRSTLERRRSEAFLP
jgi:hypothetical protein